MSLDSAGPAARPKTELDSWRAAIIEASDDSIVGNTLDGLITSWNAAAERMYGYPPEEMIGRDVAELVPPGRSCELRAIVERVRRGERIGHFDTQRVRQDGSLIEVSASVLPIRDEYGAVIGAATLARPRAQRYRVPSGWRVLDGELVRAERLEMLGNIAGGIADDFTNLLAAIINYAGFVTHEIGSQPAFRDDVAQIQAAAQRAARLTSQLLSFGRRDVPGPELLELSDIVGGLRDLMSASIGRHIDLRIETEAGLPPFVADRVQIEQVLLNLAVNAREAMPDGGTLIIRTGLAECDDDSGRRSQAGHPGRYLELTVSDTGTGMSADVVPKAFAPFFTTKPPGQGSGLGLAAVHAIVCEAGGSVSVDSVAGQGTTFHVLLPAAASAPVMLAAGGAWNGDSHGRW